MKIIKWSELASFPSFIELEKWLFENVGPGGAWLKYNHPDPSGEPIPEENDEWGFWMHYGQLYYGILDDSKAAWFILRWS